MVVVYHGGKTITSIDGVRIECHEPKICRMKGDMIIIMVNKKIKGKINLHDPST